MRLTLHVGPLDIEADSLKELDDTLRELRLQGVWSAVKGANREYEEAPVAGVEVLLEALVAEDEPEPPANLAAEVAFAKEWNQAQTDRAVKAGKIEPPVQTPPKCKTCGAPTTFGTGTGKNGSWSAYLCASGNRDHTQFL